MARRFKTDHRQRRRGIHRNQDALPGSERLTGAALDRLTHRCTILETGSESYRLRDAKRRGRSAGGTAPRPIDSGPSGK